MAMKLPTPATHGPIRGLPRTIGSLSIGALRILARPWDESAAPAMSGTTFERSRIRPLASTIPGFSRPRGPKRTSFIAAVSPFGGAFHRREAMDHASPVGAEQGGRLQTDSVGFAGSDHRSGHLLPLGNSRWISLTVPRPGRLLFHFDPAPDTITAMHPAARRAASDAGPGGDTIAEPPRGRAG